MDSTKLNKPTGYYRDEDTNTVYEDHIDLNLKLNGHLKCKSAFYETDTKYNDSMEFEDLTTFNSKFSSTSSLFETELNGICSRDFPSRESFFDTESVEFTRDIDCQEPLMVPSPEYEPFELNTDLFSLSNVEFPSNEYSYFNSDLQLYSSPHDQTSMDFEDDNLSDIMEGQLHQSKPAIYKKVDLSPKKSKNRYKSPPNPPKISQVIIETFADIIYKESKDQLTCHHCECKFVTLYEMIMHYEKFNLLKTLKYKCVVSGCAFKTIGFHRKVHLRKHLSSSHCCKSSDEILCDEDEQELIRQLIYFCDKCSKVFYRRDTLQRHERAVHKIKSKKHGH